MATTTTTAQDDDKDNAKVLMQTIVSYPSLIPYEQDLALDPYNVTKWCRYLEEIDDLLLSAQHNKKKTELFQVRAFVSQRSVSALPGSYKLWRLFLQFLEKQVYDCKSQLHNTSVHPLLVQNSSSIQKHFELVSEAYESCLIRLNKAPRIWLEYMTWENTYQTNVTHMRHLLNRALQALPLSQHAVLWEYVLQHVFHTKDNNNSNNTNTSGFSLEQHRSIPTETLLQIHSRACQLDPSKRQAFAHVCVELGQYPQACRLFMELVNDTDFVSPEGTTRHDLWMTFCDLMTQHGGNNGINFDAIVRAALPTNNKKNQQQHWNAMDKSNNNSDSGVSSMNLKEMEGTLWTKLATYHVRNGNFEMARSVYEEALERVVKVRDFSIIFDAYVKFEEQMVEAMMELEDDNDNDDDNGNGDDATSQDDWDILLGDAATSGKNSTMADMELALARAEHLTTVRRPLLLNRVLLRQNPHNVGEWLKRADLYLEHKKDTLAAAGALEEALTTVEAKYAVNGSPCELVLKLTQQVYKDDPTKTRSVYRRICNDLEYNFGRVEDLAQCHSAWVEFELAQEAWDDALSIVRRATAKETDPDKPRVVRNLFKSLQLWDLLLDLEESLGTVQTTKDAYNRAIDTKVATPMHIMNYCDFLKGQAYYEESFAAYERGIELFAFPHASAKILWTKYLHAFLDRYKDGSKMERVRDLFARCLESCPPELSSDFFMMQGELEEQHGLTKRALGVYQAMCDTVPPAEKQMAYKLLIAKTTKYLGVPATRDIYQNAIANLENRPAAEMCLDFAKTEASLHEMDRARAVYKYGAQMADPRRHAEYWQLWHEFEVAHGNEETFRDMLRVKRSVQAAFSTVNYNAAEMAGGDTTQDQQDPLTDEQAMNMIAEREGVTIQNEPRVGGFVQAKRTAQVAELGEVENRVAKLRKATANVDVKQQASEAANDDNDDEIDLDDDDDDIELEEEPHHVESSTVDEVRGVSTKAVPAAVFGGLKSDGDEAADKPKMGALERLRAAAAAKE